MATDEIASYVGRLIDDARNYITTEITPIRKLSTDYYHGKPYGNEEELRSQVVSTDVRDTVLSMMPSLMRIFAGNHERAVEFRPRGSEPQDEEEAKQKTDTVNYIIFEENDGFMMTYAAMKDALVRKTGIFKWWAEKHEKTTGQNYRGLGNEEMQALATSPGVTLKIEKTNEDQTYDFSILRKVTEVTYHVACIHPDHVAWNRGARTVEDALIVVHDDAEVLVGRLLAMGIDKKLLEDNVGPSVIKQDDVSGSDAAARDDDGAGNEAEEGVFDETRHIRYSEAYVKADFDGEGLGLWKVCTVGDSFAYVSHERIEETPIAIICVDPESHQIIGNDIADLTRDIQLIKSNVRRATMDSLAKAVDPDTVIGDGVNYDDALSKERGKIVRAEDVEQYKEFSHRFVGAETLPMEQFFDDVLEQRTGRNKNAGGLDADTLQSSTKAAVAATLSASQQRVELIARIFAETGFRRLYRGVGKMLHQNQNKEMTVRLRGKWVSVDPRSWNSNMDVVANVALGSGLVEDRVNILMALRDDQDGILQAFGLSNPFVSPRQALNTRRRLVEMAGFRNAAEFYQEITPEQEQQMQQAASQPQPPPPADPALMLQAQNDAKRVALDEQKFGFDQQRVEAELQLKKMALQLEDDRLRDFKAQEIAVKIAQIEAENQVKIDRHAVEAEEKRQRALLEEGGKMERAAQDNATKVEMARIVSEANNRPRPSIRIKKDEKGTVIEEERKVD